METMGLLLHPDGPVPDLPAVPVLLDDHHVGPAGRRALPALELGRTTLRSGRGSRRWTTSGICSRRPCSRPGSGTRCSSRSSSTAISLVCGVFAGYALSRLNFPFAGSLGTGIFITYLVPQTLLFIPLAEIIRNYHARRHALVADPDLPDVPDPVLHLADDGLLQDDPEGARGVRAHRRRLALAGDALHHHSRGDAGHPVGRHLRLHAVVERVHLRAGVPVDRPSRRRCRWA